MPIKRYYLGSAALAAVMVTFGPAYAAPAPTGVWMNDTGRGAVEVKECGQALCGHVVWVRDPNDTKGCGRQILGDVKPAGSGTWDNGWIYSPERKKKFDVELKPLDDGTLRVKGYAGTKLFSKTMIWTRAPADLARCGETQAAAPPATVIAKTEAAPKSTTIVKAASVEELQFRTKKTEPAPAPKVAAAEQPTVTPAPAPAASPPPPAEEAATDDAGGEEGLNLSDVKFDEFIKKGPNGECKLDLPWVKLNFRCEKDK